MTASPPKYFGIPVENMWDLATFNRCLFLLSTTPFYCGVSIRTYVEVPRTELMYFLALSIFRTWILVWNWVCIMELKLWNSWPTSDFSFTRNNQVNLAWSSTNEKQSWAWYVFYLWGTPNNTVNHCKRLTWLIWYVKVATASVFGKLANFTTKRLWIFIDE